MCQDKTKQDLKAKAKAPGRVWVPAEAGTEASSGDVLVSEKTAARTGEQAWATACETEKTIGPEKKGGVPCRVEIEPDPWEWVP